MTIREIIDWVRLPFRKEKELFSSLHNILGFYPHNIEYYKLALMHKSVAKRNEKGKPVNNERLEFLGDAILDAVVGDIVYKHFEGKREGFLTNARSKLVQRETLNKLAEETGLSKLILASCHPSSHNSYMGGNAFEALVGAIYLDKGYEACMQFMQKRILAHIINIDKVAYKEVNFKSKLLEWTQRNKVRMQFRLVSEGKTADNASPVFTSTVVIEGIEIGTGKGYSKKESQQTASKASLHKLRKDPKLVDAVFEAKGNRTKMEEEPVSVVPAVDDASAFVSNADSAGKHSERRARQQAPRKRSGERKDDDVKAAKDASRSAAPHEKSKADAARNRKEQRPGPDETDRGADPVRQGIIEAAEAEAYNG